jgi:hypothetical protein
MNTDSQQRTAPEERADPQQRKPAPQPADGPTQKPVEGTEQAHSAGGERPRSVHPADRDASGKHKPPLGETKPGAPFTVVALTYPIVLAIAMILLAVALWFASN